MPRVSKPSVSPEELAASIYALRSQIEELSQHKADLEAMLLDAGVETVEVRTDSYGDPGQYVDVKMTVVNSSTVTVIEDKLRKALGVARFNKMTKRVLDKSLLEDAMAKGAVSPTVVASCSEERPRKPYLRTTIKAAPKRAQATKNQVAATRISGIRPLIVSKRHT